MPSCSCCGLLGVMAEIMQYVTAFLFLEEALKKGSLAYFVMRARLFRFKHAG